MVFENSIQTIVLLDSSNGRGQVKIKDQYIYILILKYDKLINQRGKFSDGFCMFQTIYLKGRKFRGKKISRFFLKPAKTAKLNSAKKIILVIRKIKIPRKFLSLGSTNQAQI